MPNEVEVQRTKLKGEVERLKVGERTLDVGAATFMRERWSKEDAEQARSEDWTAYPWT